MSKQFLLIFLLIIVAGFILGGFYFYKDNFGSQQNNYETDGNQKYTQNGITYQKYWNADMGVSFAYRTDPNGYTLTEGDISEVDSDTLEKILILMNTEEYKEMKESDIPREGPPVISMMIFKNPENRSVRQWLENNASVANYQPETQVTDVEFGGVEGVRYATDGLYQTDVVVMRNNYKIYVISGGYLDPNDVIRKDFTDFLNTLGFF